MMQYVIYHKVIIITQQWAASIVFPFWQQSNTAAPLVIRHRWFYQVLPVLEVAQDAVLNFKDKSIFGDFINNVSVLSHLFNITKIYIYPGSQILKKWLEFFSHFCLLKLVLLQECSFEKIVKGLLLEVLKLLSMVNPAWYEKFDGYINLIFWCFRKFQN